MSRYQKKQYGKAQIEKLLRITDKWKDNLNDNKYRDNQKSRISKIETKEIGLVMGIMLILSAFVLSKTAAEYVMNTQVQKAKTVVVIDAGHGGTDIRPKKSAIRTKFRSKLPR